MASVAACPSRERVVASGAADRAVKIWDTRKRECLFTYEGHSGGVAAVAWAPEGSGAGLRLASVSDVGGVMLHSAASAGLT